MITFKRIHDEWGIQSDAPLKTGETVEVGKRDGSTTKVVVGSRFSADDAAREYVYTIQADPNRAAQANNKPTSCDNCGRRTIYLHRRTDSSGIEGWVCGACNNDDDYMLSFG